MIGNIKAVLSEDLSDCQRGARYILINEANGEVADDGGGYGYASAHNAYKAYAYKHRNRAKDYEKKVRQKEILFWLRQNPSFVRSLNNASKAEKVNAALIKRLVKECNLQDFPFKAGEFSQIWNHL